MKRRNFIKNSSLSIIGVTAISKLKSTSNCPVLTSFKSPDIVVVGAGIFGVWTAFYLQKLGAKVTLIDAYGPGNSRASSGGESRILRSDYGERLLYSKMNIRAFDLWSQYQQEWKQSFLYPSGRLNFYPEDARERIITTKSNLEKLDVASEILTADEIKYRWPQINPDGIDIGVYYPGGAGGSSLMAREACRIVAEKFVEQGGTLKIGKVVLKETGGKHSVQLDKGDIIKADKYIFACGPWMGKVFPKLFAQKLNVYRRDVFFIGPKAGDDRYSHPQMPIFSFNNADDSRFYGMPNLRGRGVKIAPWPDLNSIDMDNDDRVNNPIEIKRVREFIARRFPGLIGQPLLEGKVCQLTMSEDSHFIIDRHPDDERVWFACAGSGHAFKHGPALGEYISDRIFNNVNLPEYDEAFRFNKT